MSHELCFACRRYSIIDSSELERLQTKYVTYLFQHVNITAVT